MGERGYKEGEGSKISHMCESMGHQALRGRCPETVAIQFDNPGGTSDLWSFNMNVYKSNYKFSSITNQSL